jgi:hypothetical protein
LEALPPHYCVPFGDQFRDLHAPVGEGGAER